MTAEQLHAALTAAGVKLSIAGTELECEGEIPLPLWPLVVVLQTGLRAAVTKKAWRGGHTDRPRIEVIHPGQLIPPGVWLLCVEGDGSGGSPWDRIDPAARIDHPELFQAAADAQADEPGPLPLVA